MLYKKFWQCLNSLGVWKNKDYMRMIEARTIREEKGGFIPDSIVTVGLYSRSNCTAGNTRAIFEL